jgi:hypothetical protein
MGELSAHALSSRQYRDSEVFHGYLRK